DPDLGKVVLYQLSYSRVEPAILRLSNRLSTLLHHDVPGAPGIAKPRQPSLRAGHAARRYRTADHRVRSAAAASIQSPMWKIGPPSQGSGRGGSLSGVTAYSRHSSAIICTTVLILPIAATFTVALWPSSAIHSRRADTAISRPTITAAQKAIQGVGCPCTIRNSAVATISLSATGSRKAPKAEDIRQRRAIQPSSQSV